MSLHLATTPDGEPLGLPAGPVPCAQLLRWLDVPIQLPCEDPWLLEPDGPEGEYLRAAAQAWDEHPDWMDVLDLDSPVVDLKRAERDIYLHHWAPWLGGRRVLDVGCGVGRLATPLLDRGAEVTACDGDLRSLQRLLSHAAGRPGSLDLRWTSARKLPPDLQGFDTIVACEVLCYAPDAPRILADLTARLRPGGALLLSWEAPFGWAAAEDAPTGSLAEALAGPGVVDRPGDRWVRTVDEGQLRNLLQTSGLEVQLLERTHYLTSGPLERCMPQDVSLEEILAGEASCRAHPVWGPLHRIWTAAATRPG